jgi:hypothetical protein
MRVAVATMRTRKHVSASTKKKNAAGVSASKKKIAYARSCGDDADTQHVSASTKKKRSASKKKIAYARSCGDDADTQHVSAAAATRCPVSLSCRLLLIRYRPQHLANLRNR